MRPRRWQALATAAVTAASLSLAACGSGTSNQSPSRTTQPDDAPDTGPQSSTPPIQGTEAPNGSTPAKG